MMHSFLQYPIAKSLSTAKLCFNVSSTLLSVLSGEKRSSFFLPVIPALVRMCTAFPPLTEDARLLFTQLRHVCISKLAATSSFFISSEAINKKYLRAKMVYNSDQAFKEFLSSLPDDEALCLMLQDSTRTLNEIADRLNYEMT